ncbi:hypothetical protein pEaSNUABM54_00235 [Erwinia phage pEa_SNUABM_54]|nr:hypothetical protein pEaSNUABM54_00235 [Erwinia phage pEa_SNUABM_54]
MSVNNEATPPKDQPVYNDVVSALEGIVDPIERVKTALHMFSFPVCLQQFNDWYRDAGLLSNWLASNDVYTILCTEPGITITLDRQGRDDVQLVHYRGCDYMGGQLRIDRHPVINLIGSCKTPDEVVKSFAFQCLSPMSKPVLLLEYFGDNVGDVLAQWVDNININCPNDTNPDDIIYKLLGDATHYYRGFATHGDYRYANTAVGSIASMMLANRIQKALSDRYLHSGESRQALQARMESLLTETQRIAKLMANK